jgi:hypothetical protein
MTDMETTTVDVDKPTADVALTDSTPVETKPEEPKAEKKARGGFQHRIDKLTRDKYELEQRVREAEEKLKTTSTTEAPPSREKFDSYEEYMREEAKYIAKQEVMATIKAERDREEKNRQALTEREVWSGWENRKEDARDKYDDFDEVINQDVPITTAMQQAIMESEMGADVAYYFGNNPDEADRISKLSHAKQLLEIGKLEIKLSEPKKQSTTPAPIDPVKPSGGLDNPLPSEKDSDEVWMAKRRKQVYGR